MSTYNLVISLGVQAMVDRSLYGIEEGEERN